MQTFSKRGIFEEVVEMKAAILISLIFLLQVGVGAGMALEGDTNALETPGIGHETVQDYAETIVDRCYTWRHIVCVETATYDYN
jgi:hypothetical protein